MQYRNDDNTDSGSAGAKKQIFPQSCGTSVFYLDEGKWLNLMVSCVLESSGTQLLFWHRILLITKQEVLIDNALLYLDELCIIKA